ncbi:glycoside hydrolase family 75 protein [Streptomyces sp. NPDC006610]|uniref:glycoside hydrolase family 75 protein n=1 Tax=Streptomyces sp. NPDC006610 TaxID=3154584 RepID=UPI0033B0400A
MRVPSLTLAAASAALLAPATPPPAPVPAAPPEAAARAAGHERPHLPREHLVRAADVGRGDRSGRDGEPPKKRSVTAADLLARVRDCDPVSNGLYRTDAGRPATVPVCGTPEAVHWKADMDIDCDGRPGPRCNSRTDPYFSAGTSSAQSDGRPLDAETLPFVVVPAPSGVWNHRDDAVRGGSVAALVYRDRVRYAVVGDTGPADVIGEASYAAAEALGIPADPHAGGTDSGVTYIVFKDSEAEPIESREAAETQGERLARAFVDGGRPAPPETQTFR